MKRLTVIGISFLFLTTCIGSSAIGINKNIKNETIQNSEIKSIDFNREIITFICCMGDPLKVIFEGKYYFEMWEDDGISLVGCKFRPLLPGFRIFFKTCKHVIAPCFILLEYNVHYGACFVLGFALGDIKWE